MAGSQGAVVSTRRATLTWFLEHRTSNIERRNRMFLISRNWVFNVRCFIVLGSTDWRINFFKNSVFYRVLAWCKCNQVKQGATPASIWNKYGIRMHPNGRECHEAPNADIRASIEAPIPKRQDRCAHVCKDRKSVV